MSSKKLFDLVVIQAARIAKILRTSVSPSSNAGHHFLGQVTASVHYVFSFFVDMSEENNSAKF